MSVSDIFVVYNDGGDRAGDDGVDGDSDEEIKDTDEAFYKATTADISVANSADGCERII